MIRLITNGSCICFPRTCCLLRSAIQSKGPEPEPRGPSVSGICRMSACAKKANPTHVFIKLCIKHTFNRTPHTPHTHPGKNDPWDVQICIFEDFKTSWFRLCVCFKCRDLGSMFSAFPMYMLDVCIFVYIHVYQVYTANSGLLLSTNCQLFMTFGRCKTEQ